MKNTYTWNDFFNEELKKEYYKVLLSKLENESKSNIIYPLQDEWFKAFNLCPFNNLKVIIIGQDPYHNENQANGLAFSVNKGNKLPPSLNNIFKELNDDLNIKNESGDLSSWAKSGVLLLNSVLSVQANKANSHHQYGWLTFTNNALDFILKYHFNLVFILWGKQAQLLLKGKDTSNHCLIMSAHPSPLSSYRGFFGSKPFSKTNDYLIKHNKAPIDWHTY